MCGITGIYSPGQKINEILVQEMRDILRHRGPDDSGSYFETDIGLGHRRLKIIDLSAKGQQPMCNEDETVWLIFNGEIYNFIELREELIQQGHVFKSETDTEVIIHAYEEYGNNCLNKLNGMFSFALWNRNKRELFCARDRFGEKPFYYFIEGNNFIFASEIKAILLYLDSIGLQRRVNVSRLSDYLFYGLMDHTSETLFEGILQLSPSNYLIKKEDKIIIKKYYELNDFKSPRGDLTTQFRDHLENSIKLRLRSDVPLGALLSGGIDSTSIVSITSKLRKQNLKQDKSAFLTFTSGSTDPKFDECNYVKILSRKIELCSNIVYPDGKNLIPTLKQIIWHYDEPILGASIYAHWHLMQKAKQEGVIVLLHGQGADEFLCGYNYYFSYYLTDLLCKGQFSKFASLVDFWARKTNSSKISVIRRAFQNFFPEPYHFKLATIFRGYQKYFNISLPKINESITKHSFSILKRRSYNDIFSSNMPYILHYEDRNSMAFSLESRAPFLDHHLAGFTFSLPTSEKINGMTSKFIFRNAMRGLIPEKIRRRKDKMGFSTPMDLWLTKDAKKGIDLLFNSATFRNREYFNSTQILGAFRKYCQGNNYEKYRQVIWRGLCVELWLRIFFDKKESLKGGPS